MALSIIKFYNESLPRDFEKWRRHDDAESEFCEMQGKFGTAFLLITNCSQMLFSELSTSVLHMKNRMKIFALIRIRKKNADTKPWYWPFHLPFILLWHLPWNV